MPTVKNSINPPINPKDPRTSQNISPINPNKNPPKKIFLNIFMSFSFFYIFSKNLLPKLSKVFEYHSLNPFSPLFLILI